MANFKTLLRPRLSLFILVCICQTECKQILKQIRVLLQYLPQYLPSLMKEEQNLVFVRVYRVNLSLNFTSALLLFLSVEPISKTIYFSHGSVKITLLSNSSQLGFGFSKTDSNIYHYFLQRISCENLICYKYFCEREKLTLKISSCSYDLLRRSSALKIQQKPLNVITLSQSKSDNINQMITITDDFYLVFFSKWDIEM